MTDTLARMRQLTGTSAQWKANDLTLGLGELALEQMTDGTFRFKAGDGVRAFSALPYAPRRDFVVVTNFLDPTLDPSLDANVVATTAAFNQAIAVGRRVWVPAGTYVVQGVNLISHTELAGEGVASVLQQLATPGAQPYVLGANIGSGGSSDTTTNLKNIRVRSLKFLCPGRTPYGSAGDAQQYVHLVTVSAVTDCLFEDCHFIGYQGDGLYIGSGNTGSVERHNKNVTVRRCFFDGIDTQNRNGISIIDCDGFTCEDTTFENSTSNYQPGAIDVEPTAVYNLLRDITVRGCRFLNNKGSNGSLSVYLVDIAYTTQPSGFTFADNIIDGGTTQAEFGILFVHVNPANPARYHNLRISGNRLRRVNAGFRFGGVVGLVYDRNTMTDVVASPLLSYSDGTRKCQRVRLRDNDFTRIAADNSTGGNGVNIFDVDYLLIDGNTFTDCGKVNGTFGYCLDFKQGTSSYVTLRANRFLNPGGKTTFAIQKDAGHTFTRTTNRYFDNDLVGCSGNAFDAEDSDIVESSYTPIVTGATSAGAGTYNVQFGRYTRRGKLVYFQVAVDVQAGHTGTGVVQISLPLNSKGQPSNQSVAVGAIEHAGLTGLSIQAYLNPAAVVGGVTGALRLAALNTGAADAAVSIPAGAFHIWVSGSYMTA